MQNKFATDGKIEADHLISPVLKVKEAYKTFGGLVAINKVSFDVKEGEEEKQEWYQRRRMWWRRRGRRRRLWKKEREGRTA